MKTNRIFILAILFCSFSVFTAQAQEPVADEIAPEGYEWADSLVYTRVDAVDSSYLNKNIFELVEVEQSEKVRTSMQGHIESNQSRVLNGYRVRIFFDNKQTSRQESADIVRKFTSIYPSVPAYRSYTNPYFKVTVGDFRTKSEAVVLLEEIKKNFPSAFVVKDKIKWPAIDPEKSYLVDTVRVLRPVK